MDGGKKGEATEVQKTEEEIAQEKRGKLIRQEKARLALIDKVFLQYILNSNSIFPTLS